MPRWVVLPALVLMLCFSLPAPTAAVSLGLLHGRRESTDRRASASAIDWHSAREPVYDDSIASGSPKWMIEGGLWAEDIKKERAEGAKRAKGAEVPHDTRASDSGDDRRSEPAPEQEPEPTERAEAPPPQAYSPQDEEEQAADDGGRGEGEEEEREGEGEESDMERDMRRAEELEAAGPPPGFKHTDTDEATPSQTQVQADEAQAHEDQAQAQAQARNPQGQDQAQESYPQDDDEALQAQSQAQEHSQDRYPREADEDARAHSHASPEDQEREEQESALEEGEGAEQTVSLANGAVMKQITTPGTGALPVAGDVLSMDYVGTLTDGTEFDSSVKRGKPFQFKLGQGEVIKCWDLAMATMLVGEVASVSCRSDYAYGGKGSPPTIPASANLYFHVTRRA